MDMHSTLMRVHMQSIEKHKTMNPVEQMISCVKQHNLHEVIKPNKSPLLKPIFSSSKNSLLNTLTGSSIVKMKLQEIRCFVSL